MFSETVHESGILNREQHIIVNGKVHDSIYKKIKNGLKKPVDNTCSCFFLERVSLDVEIGRKFEIIFECDNIDNFIECETKIVSVTQQFGFPEVNIPHGWNTIAIICFPNGIPDFVDNFPVIEEWYDKKGKDFCFSDKDFWEEIRAMS